MSPDELLAEALRLTRVDRAPLAEEPLSSLEESDEEVAAAAACCIAFTALESRALKSTTTIARRGLGLSPSFLAPSTTASINTASACRLGNSR